MGGEGGVLRYVRLIVVWSCFFVAVGQILIWAIHFFENTSGTDNCKTMDKKYGHDDDGKCINKDLCAKKEYSCIGNRLMWADDDFTCGNSYFNKDFSTQKLAAGQTYLSKQCLNDAWRSTFTFKPAEFVDVWTPFVFGAISFMQHISVQMKAPMITGNWMKVAVWHVIMALWGMFGYAGNLGVLFGFWCCCLIAPLGVTLGALNYGGETPGTTANVAAALALVGIKVGGAGTTGKAKADDGGDADGADQAGSA